MCLCVDSCSSSDIYGVLRVSMLAGVLDGHAGAVCDVLCQFKDACSRCCARALCRADSHAVCHTFRVSTHQIPVSQRHITLSRAIILLVSNHECGIVMLSVLSVYFSLRYNINVEIYFISTCIWLGWSQSCSFCSWCYKSFAVSSLGSLFSGLIYRLTSFCQNAAPQLVVMPWLHVN